MSWVLMTLTYGLLKGARDIVKKESLKRSSVVEVLFFYTLFAFLICIPVSNDIASVDVRFLPAIFIKSFVIFIAWILSFKAIMKMPLSLYGILDLSRVMAATLLGIFVLHEPATRNQMVGLILVGAGLLLLKRRKNEEDENVKPQIIIIALISCALNAISGLLDKILTRDVTPSQLQFYYMLFLTLLYLGYLIIDRQEVNIKESVKNYWIWILAILFVIADKSLFIANANPNSRITIMTLIKQSGCIITLLAGKFIYKEKNMMHKFICASIIIAGIVIAVI